MQESRGEQTLNYQYLQPAIITFRKHKIRYEPKAPSRQGRVAIRAKLKPVNSFVTKRSHLHANQFQSNQHNIHPKNNAHTSQNITYKDISNKPSFLSKRFAAKEALSKALGFGLYRKGIYPKYISVKHDDFGKPFLSLSSELEKIINNHNMKIQLSITDSDTQSVAFVVIES